ncbi:hypothetical protein CAC42_763 [Sphaceloma murrayae]|uniref:Beta-lactamase-related domain-containing protein n=1 Tax=Sphaceloma murrayae TaxID=2082308 RepID=A0A2K1QK10_9PEZI|nr:hypothetical protein CAC42_763 [Sphaceloma murrayae]
MWSSTKPITSLTALVLISRGLISPSDPVSKYWPEFAAAGKDQTPITFAELMDVPYSTKLLAAQAPWWEPGTQSGYHSLTYGHLIGEVVLRVTGKTLGKFIEFELAGPLGADFRLGCPQSEWGRIAETVPPPPPEAGAAMPAHITPGSVAMRVFTSPAMDAQSANSESWRKSECGAGNGHGNARGLARLLEVVARGGTVDGKEILTPETVDLIFEEQCFGQDLVIGKKVRMGMGFGLWGKEWIGEFLPEGKTAFWGGWGGSPGAVDVPRGLVIAYVMNKMENGEVRNTACRGYVKSIYDILQTKGEHQALID